MKYDFSAVAHCPKNRKPNMLLFPLSEAPNRQL